VVSRRAGPLSGPNGAAPGTAAADAGASATHGASVRLQYAALSDGIAAEPVAARAAFTRRARLQLSPPSQSGPRGSTHPAEGQPLPDKHAKEI
jgi:hypothetical protein